jgi:putative acetyltransferase
MIQTLRTDWTHPHFKALTALLDEEMSVIDGEEHSFYAQFDKIDNIKYAIVAYADGEPAGCGSIKHFSGDSAEVKRMFVHTSHRRLGIAARVVAELEAWAKELGYKYSVLETGKRMPHALALYTRMGYEVIPNYGQYVGVDNSICFRKNLG